MQTEETTPNLPEDTSAKLLSEKKKASRRKRRDNDRKWALAAKIGAAGLGLVSVIVGLTQLYVFFNPEKPQLSAKIYEAANLVPTNLRDEIITSANKNTVEDFFKSLSEDKKKIFLENYRKSFTNELEEFINKKKEADTSLIADTLSLQQKIRIVVTNEGGKEAQDINIELPPLTTGYYTIEYSEDPKKFTRVVPVGNIRPKTQRQVDIWVRNKLLNHGQIDVNYPEGTIPLSVAFLVEKKSFFQEHSYLILIIENILLFFILFWIGLKSFKKEIKTTEVEKIERQETNGNTD